MEARLMLLWDSLLEVLGPEGGLVSRKETVEVKGSLEPMGKAVAVKTKEATGQVKIQQVGVRGILTPIGLVLSAHATIEESTSYLSAEPSSSWIPIRGGTLFSMKSCVSFALEILIRHPCALRRIQAGSPVTFRIVENGTAGSCMEP
jgi:hypothetical protein